MEGLGFFRDQGHNSCTHRRCRSVFLESRRFVTLLHFCSLFLRSHMGAAPHSLLLFYSEILGAGGPLSSFLNRTVRLIRCALTLCIYSGFFSSMHSDSHLGHVSSCLFFRHGVKFSLSPQLLFFGVFGLSGHRVVFMCDLVILFSIF